MLELLKQLNVMTPLGLAAMLAAVLWMQAKNRTAVKHVSDNHLSGLPEMQSDIKTIVVLLESQQRMLQSINDNLVYLKARVNGRS